VFLALRWVGGVLLRRRRRSCLALARLPLHGGGRVDGLLVAEVRERGRGAVLIHRAHHDHRRRHVGPPAESTGDFFVGVVRSVVVGVLAVVDGVLAWVSVFGVDPPQEASAPLRSTAAESAPATARRSALRAMRRDLLPIDRSVLRRRDVT
jgi:hypothetical protein